MTHFDDKAATWDDDPDHVKRAVIIAERLKLALKDTSIKNAMEYGSGTGQLSFELKSFLPSITLMDESINMTKVTQQKCYDLGVDNLHPIKYDLILDQPFNEKYDLIYSLLTLHHIENTKIILEKFKQILNPGGLLILIDLEKEDGSFHDYDFDGHLGFDRKELEMKLNRVGFSPIHYEVCYSINKEMENGQVRGYPLFLLVSKKQP